ncbi:hypothetical protein [Paraburkholderia dinghuensis]|uniref:hypothetical protein n=1 Tax=Paraburkholderia dinghuensis TaxID=2305225 RepID=UPI0016235725|nr:hypothetical protein [Paraburkholderia dinghuensis]
MFAWFPVRFTFNGRPVARPSGANQAKAGRKKARFASAEAGFRVFGAAAQRIGNRAIAVRFLPIPSAAFVRFALAVLGCPASAS